MPVPSTRTASRRQRATPLKHASTTWWVLPPALSRTCSVSPAAVANDCQKGPAGPGRNGGGPGAGALPAGLAPRVQRQPGGGGERLPEVAGKVGVERGRAEGEDLAERHLVH